ncbi:Predicted amidohydrolase [Desulfonispora thiosulfatigenes DSM 11270]|uniref:Predicted amidohydrolase n=1 Tax=Desulfonispora thiosulfatigenes DSM 11270 TaxID=656914 RepID=A0A1W1VHF5_DESTI|nr:nitrilase-related carbon-nitrogen hydrolase [Desulfonispora thiosulfatigenes]SMB92766.1 Predicted amidohydrolase [Desulfonispora thiosulfatigenes DSM 11270]
MESVRIALVQMQSFVGKTHENLAKIKKHVQEAKKKGVQIICFPELAAQGYTRKRAKELAEISTGYCGTYLSNLSKEYDIQIIAGLIEKSENDKPYITQLIIDQGKINKYRKTHIGESEELYFTPGNELPVFASTLATIGVQICFDCHFPEVSTVQAIKGAEIIFAPHASPTMVKDRKEIWLKYLRARAYDNGVYVAACNLIGQNGDGSDFIGGTLVIDPKGNIIGEDFNGEEAMLIVDLPKEKINILRQNERKTMRNSFYLKSRRPEIYKELTD